MLLKENKRLTYKLNVQTQKCKYYEQQLEKIYNYQKRINRLQKRMFNKNNKVNIKK